MKQGVFKNSVVALLVIVISFFFFSFVAHRRIEVAGLPFGQSTTFDTNALADYATDFILRDDGMFYSETADPWFSIELDYGIKTIVIDVDSVDGTCNAQIFYYNDNEALEQERSVWTVLNHGRFYIQIPAGNYNVFRLDLTEKENVGLKINSVSFHKNRCLPMIFWISYAMFLAFACELAVMLRKYKAICGQIGEYRYFKYVLAIAISISCILVYGALVNAGHQYVYYDIGGGDEPESYIPLFSSYIQKLQNHELAEWTWNNGLGTSMSGFWGYMANPFTFLVIITGVFFGMSSINIMVLVAQLLNILAVGLLCYRYLSYFDGKCRSKAIASYMAAFSGYMILYAQHYVHAEFGIYIFITLILVEEILKAKRFSLSHILLAIDCAFMFVCTVYLAYMIAIFTGIYTIFRLVQKYDGKQCKEALSKLGQILGAAVIGFLISMPFVLVVVNELLYNSDRVSSEKGMLAAILDFLLVPYHKEAFVTIFLRLLSSNLQGAGNDFWGQTDSYACDYYASPELFYSIFIFAFAAVYYVSLSSRFREKKQRVVRIIAGLLTAFVIFNRLGSAIFNAFVAPFGRYTYLLLPLFAIITVVSIDQLEEQARSIRITYILSCAFTAAVLFAEAIFVLHSGKPKYTILLAAIDIVLVVFLAFLCSTPCVKRRKLLVGAFSTLVFANVVIESYVTVNKRAFCLFSEDITDQDDYDTQDALAYLKNADDSMYRVEKNYYDIIYFNDAYLQNYRGVSTYNSTLNANVKEFYRLYCNPAINFYGADSFWYSYMNVTNDIVQSSVLGVKYYLSNATAYDESLFEKVYTNGGTAVYKNRAIDSFGVFYENAIPKNEVLNLGYADRVGVLSGAVVLEDEDVSEAHNVVDYDSIKAMLDEKPRSYSRIASDGNYMKISLDDAVDDGALVSYLEFSSNLAYADHMMIYFDQGDGYQVLTPYYYRGNDERNQEARIALPSGTQRIKFESSIEDYEVDNLRIVATAQSYVPHLADIRISAENDSHLQGTVQNGTDGYLLLPIPYEKGWTVTVDGKQAELLQADSGFMAIYLEEGSHNIKAEYHFPGEKCGIIFSAFGIGILLLEGAYLFRAKKTARALCG